MARALAEGTEDGRLFVHAAVIAAADGRRADAARWAEQSAKPQLHAASFGAGGAPEGARHATTPSLRSLNMLEHVRRALQLAAAAALLVCPAIAERLQSHGCAAHHPGRRGEHHRRLCVRVVQRRRQVPDDRARGLPARGAGHRARTSTTSTTTSSTRSASRPATTSKKGRTTYAYQFRFDTTYRNRDTILQSYLGVIDNVGDAAQNLIQRYTRHQGRLPHRHDHAARTRHRPAQQPGQRDAEVQPQQRRRTARQGRRGRRGRPRRLHGAVDRRARGRLHAPSPVSATTGSMPTSRRSSIC